MILTVTEMLKADHWMEWKQTCALDLCGAAAQAELKAFVHRRFRRYISGYLPPSPAWQECAPAIEPGEAWHWFETYFQLNRRRSGKRYKDWLFARVNASAPALECIESGASLLLRDVVRDRLRKEHPHPRARALAEPSSGRAGALTLEELLPCASDTAGEVAQRDLEALADRLADAVLGEFTTRERLAVVVRERGLSCANPDVLKRAGCGKTALAEAHPAALKKIAGHARKACPGESAEALAALAVALFDAVRFRLMDWAKTAAW